MSLLQSILGKKKRREWQEVTTEENENLAKAVMVYWQTLGYKTVIKKRRDRRWSVFVLDTIKEAKEFGVKRPPARFELA